MKLSIQPLLPIGNYLNKRYGIEMDFPDDSNPADNFKYLNEVVISIHMAECPFFYKDGKPLYLPQQATTATYNGEEQTEKSVQVDKIPDNPVDNMIKAITTCTTPDILQTFEKLSKSKQEFTDAYNNRMGVLLLRSLYTIFDKNDMELPEHYSGRGRTWDEAKKLVEGLNKTGEFKPYTIKNQSTITV